MPFCPQCASRVVAQIIQGEERMACSSTQCNFVLWENPTPVVAALVQLDQHFILARNANWPPGQFSILTGYLEKHEAPESAVLREVKEELGLDAEIKQFIGHYPFVAKNQLIIAYWVDGHGPITLDDELAEYKRLGHEVLSRYDFGPFLLTRQIIADCGLSC